MLSMLVATFAFAAPAGPVATVCRSAAHCAFVARESLLDGQIAKAGRAAALQLHFAECGAPERVAAALDTLARVALKRREPLMARAWLAVDANEQQQARVPRATVRAVAAAVARLPPTTTLSGVYRSYKRAGVWDSLTVHLIAGGRIRFELDASRLSSRWCDDPQAAARGDLSFVVATMGGMSGVAELQGDAFVYENREPLGEDTQTCVMRFRFTPDAVTVQQDGRDIECGFGGGVDASGDYVRTSRRP